MLGNFRLCKPPNKETLKNVGLLSLSTRSPETELRNSKWNQSDEKDTSRTIFRQSRVSNARGSHYLIQFCQSLWVVLRTSARYFNLCTNVVLGFN